MGFAASVAGRCKHQQQIAVQLQSRLDGILLGFWFLTCTFSSLFSSGSGQTGILIPHLQQALFVVGNFFRLFAMDNLRDTLEQKYFTNSNEKYSVEQVANDVINLFNAGQNNYFDVTGFAKDFYLSSSLTQDEKKHFYNELKAKSFFQSLNTYLYSEDFAVCSWTIYTIGKFSNNENAGYLEAAYEKSFGLTNPILSYRCLSELDWLSSKKVEQYLANLKADNSIISKLILLYYWEIKSYSAEFKDLLTDKDLIAFIAPNQTLVDTEDEINDRLFAFENYVSGLYNSTIKGLIDKNEFETIARNFFKTYSKPVDEQADKDHQDFLKQFNSDK